MTLNITPRASAVEFDTSSLKPNGRYAVETEINFRWVRFTGNDSKPLVWKNLAEAVSAAQAVVVQFDPAAEYIPTAVRIVRIGFFLRGVIEVTPEVKVSSCYVEICVDGGPDCSPAGPNPDPIPWGERGWLSISDYRSAFSPATLVQLAKNNLRRDDVYAARIYRSFGEGTQVVWSSDAAI